MAASPGDPSGGSPPPSPFMWPATPPGAPVKANVCRLCAKEGPNLIDIFSDVGKQKDLPGKIRLCLPIMVTQNDELSKAVCSNCIDDVEMVRTFFQKCFTSNQELIIALRKSRVSPLDLPTHINQYVRSFNPPVVPQIKIEPSSYLDVDLAALDGDTKSSNDYSNGYYDDEWIVDEDDEDDDDEDEDEDDDQEDQDLSNGEDIFKVPKIPSTKRKKKRVGRPRKVNPDGTMFDPYFDNDSYRLLNKTNGNMKKFSSPNGVSSRGRKRFVPLALKTCSFCGQEFADHAGNLSHWKEAHPDQDIEYKCSEVDRSSEEQCNFISKESEEIFKHRNKHKIRDLPDVKPEVNIDCKICGKYFTTSFLINRHMLVHEDRKDFKCGVCGLDSKSDIDLKAHLRTHDPEDVKYAHCCELCGKRFTQRANLDAHIRVHSGYKPYSCDFCGKSFSQKGNMEEHRRVHTGERPFVCEQCGSSFVRRSEMALHNRIAHTGERPYQCAYCPKNFQRRDLMRKHERIHTDTRPYSCQFCNKAFTQRDKMVVHTRLHTGERPYVCEVCGKGFCESGNLKKHMRVHGKEPPHIMHQNNKGKPAPNQQSSTYDTKPNMNLLAQQQFQQQMTNESETNSNASHVANNPRPESVTSPTPSLPPQPATPTPSISSESGSVVGNNSSIIHSQNLPLHIKLQDQHGQHPFAAVAAALHNQMPSSHHSMNSYSNNVNNVMQSRHTATPIHDIDNMSEAGSERSVNSPFVSSQQPHPAHHQPPQATPNLPYHMHHSLIQHLSDMRDLYGGHLPPGGGQGVGGGGAASLNHHNLNH